MAKLVDLKRTKAEQKERNSSSKLSAPDSDEYPYGLTVSLDHDALDKLGMKTMPKAGTKLHLHAHAHVKSVEETHHAGGKKRRHMSLELQKMALEATQRASDEPGIREGKLTGAKAAMDKALDAQEGPDEG
jgi:hypothetical protein